MYTTVDAFVVTLVYVGEGISKTQSVHGTFNEAAQVVNDLYNSMKEAVKAGEVRIDVTAVDKFGRPLFDIAPVIYEFPPKSP